MARRRRQAAAEPQQLGAVPRARRVARERLEVARHRRPPRGRLGERGARAVGAERARARDGSQGRGSRGGLRRRPGLPCRCDGAAAGCCRAYARGHDALIVIRAAIIVIIIGLLVHREQPLVEQRCGPLLLLLLVLLPITAKRCVRRQRTAAITIAAAAVTRPLPRPLLLEGPVVADAAVAAASVGMAGAAAPACPARRPRPAVVVVVTEVARRSFTVAAA